MLTQFFPFFNFRSDCKLRVFALANKKNDLNRDQRNMAALLNKFRIQYSDVIVIADIMNPPLEENRRAFNNLISKWRYKENLNIHENANLMITDSELLALKDKTNRHIRLRELLSKYSTDATLIVMYAQTIKCQILISS